MLNDREMVRRRGTAGGWRMAALAVALAVAPLAAAGAADAGPARIEVGVGDAAMVRLARPAKQVIIGNPAVADVVVENARTLTVFGRQVGATTLSVMDGRGDALIDGKVMVAPGEPDDVTVTWVAGKAAATSGATSAAYVCGAATCVMKAPAGGAGAAPAPATPGK